MADKSEFVDMISEATRQMRRRYAARRRKPEVKEIAAQSLAAGPVGAVADRDAHAMEAQALEIQELGLSRHFRSQPKSGARSGA